MRREEYEPKGIRRAADYHCQRPRLIQIYKSSGVNIRNNIRDSEGGHGPSTGGIDLDSSSNVLVQHCDIECNDDAICLKAAAAVLSTSSPATAADMRPLSLQFRVRSAPGPAAGSLLRFCAP